jgi:maleate cis-trans isomerase
VAGTTFRSFEAAEGLEQDLGIPIVTSNRSVFKAIVRQFGEG